MAEPASTRLIIRRAIALRARMPFFLAYGDTDIVLEENVASDAQASDAIYSVSLTQPENYWQNAWVYVSDSLGVYGSERRIQAFERSTHKLVPEWPLAAAPATDAHIEIYHIWPPSQINTAINDAIEKGGEFWPAQQNDESLVVIEDRLTYDLTGLTVTPWKSLQWWVERSQNSVTGEVASATSATLTVDSGDDLSNADTDWFVSIYDGTGKGQLRSFVSADTATNIITLVAWTTNPDTTSKYRWWDADEQWHDWMPLTGIRHNRKDYPDKMYLANLMPAVYGFRFRYVYLGWPSALSADSEETTVPKEFLVNQALSNLHYSMIADNRVDRQTHGGSAETFADLADEYARLHRRRVLAGTLWAEEDDDSHYTSAGDAVGDPMRWR